MESKTRPKRDLPRHKTILFQGIEYPYTAVTIPTLKRELQYYAPKYSFIRLQGRKDDLVDMLHEVYRREKEHPSDHKGYHLPSLIIGKTKPSITSPASECQRILEDQREFMSTVDTFLLPEYRGKLHELVIKFLDAMPDDCQENFYRDVHRQYSRKSVTKKGDARKKDRELSRQEHEAALIKLHRCSVTASLNMVLRLSALYEPHVTICILEYL
jgi:hypothetical protein